MSGNESKQESKDHESQDILPSKAKSNDVTVDMDLSANYKVEEPNKGLTESDVSIDISLPKPARETNFADVIGDNGEFTKDFTKQSIKETNESNEKSLENSTYITMRVYDTYYGQHQPQQHPHQQHQFARQPLHQQYPSPWGGGGYYGPETLQYEPGNRNYFVKLVFTILLTMVVMTSIFIAIVITSDGMKEMFRRHSVLFMIIGLVLILTCHYSMFLSACSRVPPCNIFLLLLTVVAYCILTGIITSRYRTELVFYAALATTAVVFVCLMLACTSFDFTSWILYVVAIAAVFSVIAAIVCVVAFITGHYPKPLHIAILVIGTLLQVVMLIIELQMILGGKNIELNEDDYALGAFMLYTSIMSLFMNLLQLIGLSD